MVHFCFRVRDIVGYVDLYFSNEDAGVGCVVGVGREVVGQW